MAILPLLGACQPNPRNEIRAIAEAAMAELRRTSHDPGALCVDRVIAPWTPADDERRVDPAAPAGFDDLYGAGVFRGGGGIAGAAIGGVPLRGGETCFDLRGPLVNGDRAMLQAHLPGFAWNAWLRRTDGRWRFVGATHSRYLE